MADKKKPKVTPIATQIKQVASSPTLNPAPPLVIPEKFAGIKVTAKNLSSRSIQGKIQAFHAIKHLFKLFHNLEISVEAGDVAAMRLVAQMYGLVEGGKAGTVVNVQQNNNNQTANISASGSKGLATPDAIFRMLADEQETRQLGPARRVVDLVATPVEYEKTKPVEE